MSNDNLSILRHSAAHVMAYALTRLYPEIQLAIGPATEDGFYYDFELACKLTEDDFAAIETQMAAIIREDIPFTRTEITKEEGLALFAGQKYKLAILKELPESEPITVYALGDFKDLCRGPHIERSGQLNAAACKLLSLAGAYWRGDEKNAQLQRLYATAFAAQQELETHLELLAELEKRDHRRIGREQELFSFHEEAGPGLTYWHPMGGRVRVALENFWREQHYKNGYEMIFTPHIGKSWLWETSGHLDFYKESMYSPMQIDEIDYYAKPMNCPFHIMIYNTGKKSYRQLPCRWAELGTVYRYERSGTLHGLMRVRGFTQDDAHIFCTPAQLADEIAEVLRFSLFMLRTFNFTDIKPFLSTRPEKSVGEESRWQEAEQALRSALENAGLVYGIDEGGGAFYGPKIDLKVKDSMGREWQLSTIQVDFNLPERFNMVFVDQDGKEKRPYMVHRALLGSIERFFGVLVEHFGGAFPPWLSPIQAIVVPVSPKFSDYAAKAARRLQEAGLRAQADLSDERMQAKIRKANELRAPYTLIVGGRDEEAGTASIKVRGGGDMPDLPLSQAAAYIAEKVKTLAVDL